uniref:RRM domain-containing protein n=1 Tax=Gouania willdenowi TaxID=441366 RepID=A0A8C5ET27_GOUWI
MLFVGNIPHDVEKTELMEFFEQFGSVLDFKIISRGKHPNFGFVVFNDSELVQKILSSRLIELFDNVESEGRRMVRYPDAHQLFVGNIPHDVEKPELMEFFEQFGSVLDFKIISRGKHPNFGFVVFNDSEPVQKILSSRPIEFPQHNTSAEIKVCLFICCVVISHAHFDQSQLTLRYGPRSEPRSYPPNLIKIGCAI